MDGDHKTDYDSLLEIVTKQMQGGHYINGYVAGLAQSQNQYYVETSVQKGRQRPCATIGTYAWVTGIKYFTL